MSSRTLTKDSIVEPLEWTRFAVPSNAYLYMYEDRKKTTIPMRLFVPLHEWLLDQLQPKQRHWTTPLESIGLDQIEWIEAVVLMANLIPIDLE